MLSEVGPYECLDMVGEGTYGVVVRARHRTTGLMVAIKQFKRVKGDCHAKKVATREVRVLRQLRHPNIVRLIEVIRDASEGSFHLVFEFVERTVLQCLDQTERGVDPQLIRRYMYQLLRCLEYCHASNVIHRDVKPENILISSQDIVKVCDFGFARLMLTSDSFLSGSKYTDYVATRWYRAPELLVGKTDYTTAVDVWAVGCVFAELTTKLPLFPGKTDVDMLARIIACCGALPSVLVTCFHKNPLYAKARLPAPPAPERRNHLYQQFRDQSPEWLAFLTSCLHVDPEKRLTCTELLASSYFTHDNFHLEMDKILKENDMYAPPPTSPNAAALRKQRKLAAAAQERSPTKTKAAFLAEGGAEKGPTMAFRSSPRYHLLPLLTPSRQQAKEREREERSVVEEKAKVDGELDSGGETTSIRQSECREGQSQGPYFLRLPPMKPYFSSVGNQPHRQLTFRRVVPGAFGKGFHPTISPSPPSPSSMPRASSPPPAGSPLLRVVHRSATQRGISPARLDASNLHGVAVSNSIPKTSSPTALRSTKEEEVAGIGEERRGEEGREASEMIAIDRRGSSPMVERQTLPMKETEVHPHDDQYLPHPPLLYRHRRPPARLFGSKKRYQLTDHSNPDYNSGIAFASAPIWLPSMAGERSLFSKRHL